MIGCTAIGQVEGAINEAKIKRIAILPDSTSLYFIYWGHTFLYDGNKISEVKMTKENKELLLKDLCARLPYMPKIKITYQQQGIKGTDEGNVSCDFIERIVNDLRNGVITDMQIYLRPMSSMTEEEKKEFESIWDSGFGKALDAQISNLDDCVIRNLEINASSNAIDWLNKKMFAYRTIDGKDMFELGIALKAPEEMYK